MLRLLEQLQQRPPPLSSTTPRPPHPLQHDTTTATSTTARHHDRHIHYSHHSGREVPEKHHTGDVSQLASRAVRLLVQGDGPHSRESRLVHPGQTEMDVQLHLTLAVTTRRGVIGQQVGSDPARRGPDSAHHRLERTYPGASLRGHHQARRPVRTAWCNKARGMCYPVCGMVHI